MDQQIYFNSIMSLTFILGLIFLAAWIIKKLGYGVQTPKRKNKKRRLALIEVLPIDPRRRLLLIKRDDVEHLVMTSVNGDLLIEKNILDEDFDEILEEAGKIGFEVEEEKANDE